MYHQFKVPIDSDIACKLPCRLRGKKSFSHFYIVVDEWHFMGLDEKQLSLPILQANSVQFQFTNTLLSPQEYRLQIKN